VLLDLAAVAALLASAPTEPAPANVHLAWVSAAHEEFAVTWAETGEVRNKIDLLAPDGTALAIASRFTEPGQPDRVTIGTSGLFGQSFIVRVTVVDAADDELSGPADSPEFDTDRTAPPVITGAVPRVDGSIVLTWMPGRYLDPNPGDPLDLPAEEPPRYVPVASAPTMNDYYPVGREVRGAGSLVIKDRPAPVSVGLRNVPNEWYGYGGATVKISGAKLTAKMPSAATIGGRLTVTGTATEVLRYCDPGPCWTGDRPGKDRALKLQTRTGLKWRTVATTRARADGTYRFTTAFAATGDYRVVAPPVAWKPDDRGLAYVETAARTVTGKADDAAGLPITGTPVMRMAVAGGLLVVLGAVFAVAGRLRRRGGS